MFRMLGWSFKNHFFGPLITVMTILLMDCAYTYSQTGVWEPDVIAHDWYTPMGILLVFAWVSTKAEFERQNEKEPGGKEGRARDG